MKDLICNIEATVRIISTKKTENINSEICRILRQAPKNITREERTGIRHSSQEPKYNHTLPKNMFTSTEWDGNLLQEILHANSRSSKVCGLPRIHKELTLLRPIVSTVGRPTHKLAEHLTTFLICRLPWLLSIFRRFLSELCLKKTLR